MTPKLSFKRQKEQVIWKRKGAVKQVVTARFSKHQRQSETKHECENQSGCLISSQWHAIDSVESLVGCEVWRNQPMENWLISLSFPKYSFLHFYQFLCLEQSFAHCSYFDPFKIYSELLSGKPSQFPVPWRHLHRFPFNKNLYPTVLSICNALFIHSTHILPI